MKFIGILLLLTLLSLGTLVQTLEIVNNFDTIRSWEFVARYAFIQESEASTQAVAQNAYSMMANVPDNPFAATNLKRGRGTYHIKFPRYTKHKLVIFNGLDDWKQIEEESYSCSELIQKAHNHSRQAAIIDLTESTAYSVYDPTQTIVYQNLGTATNATGVFWFPDVSEAVARWGVILLTNCALDSELCITTSNCQGPVTADVNMSLYNGMVEDSPVQLSFDERGMTVTSFLFFFMQLLCFVAALNTRSNLIEMKKYHLTVKLLVASTSLQLFALFFSVLFWSTYADNGRPMYALLTLYRYCQSLANFCLILQVIMLGKGWTIVRPTLSPMGSLKLVAYATSYVSFTIFAETYAYGMYQVSRAGSFFYQSPPGILILLLRCILATAWFIYAVSTTMANFQSKKSFFLKFKTVFTVWLVLPAIFVLITLGISAFYWVTYTYIWEATLLLVAQYLLIIMYNPHFLGWNSTFPFNQNHLPELGTWPWSVLPNVKNFRKRVEMAAGGASHALVPGRVENLEYVDIRNVYQDIRDNSYGLIGVTKKLVPTVDEFKDILDDWDVEIDMDDENLHED